MEKTALMKPQSDRRSGVEAYSCETSGKIGNVISAVGLGLLVAGLIIGTGGVAGGIILGYGIAGTIAGGGLGIASLVGC